MEERKGYDMTSACDLFGSKDVSGVLNSLPPALKLASLAFSFMLNMDVLIL